MATAKPQKALSGCPRRPDPGANGSRRSKPPGRGSSAGVRSRLLGHLRGPGARPAGLPGRILFVKDYQARNATIAETRRERREPPVATRSSEHAATGNQQHVPEGTKVNYDQTPPDSGKHYPARRRSPSASTRPRTGRPSSTLVHNLEHGYTVVWYRDGDARQTRSEPAAADRQDVHRRRLRPGRQVHRRARGPTPTAPASPPARTSCSTRWYADPQQPSRAVAAEGCPAALRARSAVPAIKDFMAKYPVDQLPGAERRLIVSAPIVQGLIAGPCERPPRCGSRPILRRAGSGSQAYAAQDRS